MSDVSEDAAALHPRHGREVLGHEEVERLLLADAQRGTLPGAYLFCGPKGIGKATLAYRLARYLLAHPPGAAEEEGPGLFGDILPPVLPTSLTVDTEHPVARRIASGGHANLLTIEPSWDEKKKARRSDILVDDVRKIGNFLSLSAGEGGWRIVLIDAADEMNVNAANAILKWLEEPPQQAMFILIAHHPGKLLATIRSRCRVVTFCPLEEEVFRRILAQHDPSLGAAEMNRLYFLSEGAPGRAISLLESGMPEVFSEVLALYAQEPPQQALEQFAVKLAAGRKELSFAALSALLMAVLGGVIRAHEGVAHPGDAAMDASERATLQRMAAKKPLDYWLDLWEKSAALLADTDRIHLDARQVLAGVLTALAGRESIVYYLTQEA